MVNRVQAGVVLHVHFAPEETSSFMTILTGTSASGEIEEVLLESDQ